MKSKIPLFILLSGIYNLSFAETYYVDTEINCKKVQSDCRNSQGQEINKYVWFDSLMSHTKFNNNVYKFYSANAYIGTDHNSIYFSYHSSDGDSIRLEGVGDLKPDLQVTGNKWIKNNNTPNNLNYYDCNSNNPHECPFTNAPY